MRTLHPTLIPSRKPAGLLQRQCKPAARDNGFCGARALPPSVGETLRSPGHSLDAATRQRMELAFDRDFSHVRLHTDKRAATSASAVDARAYTVGRNIVFGSSEYAPATASGRALLAHELTHTIQQDASDRNEFPTSVNGYSHPGDPFEREADAAATGVMAAGSASVALRSPDFAIQRESPGTDAAPKPPEKPDAGDTVVEGLKTVAEEAKDDNPKVKKVIIDPLKDRLKLEWNRLSTGEKVGVVGFGAGTVGMAGGALLSDPAGRKTLEGINLAAPLTLIPYMPLSSFKYTLPSGTTGDQRLFKFETSFDGSDLINLRTEARGLPKMSLGVNMQWGYDPKSERLTLLGGDASLGLVPGLSLSAGAYKDVLRPTPTFIGPDGETTQVKKSVPEFGKPQPIPDVRIMVNVDLMKFKPGDLVRQVKGIFGGGR